MSAPMLVAGREVGDPLAVASEYIQRHFKTVDVYDGAVDEVGPLTRSMIAATRKISSRISQAQGDVLVEIVNATNWDKVPPGARLEEADPAQTGLLFDDAAALFNHVLQQAPPGIASGKVHKVLHLRRPNLIPILDSRLRALYKARSREVAAGIRGKRADFPYDRSYWGAIREDLIANAGALDTVREVLATRGEREKRVAETTTNLRLLDMVCWKIG